MPAVPKKLMLMYNRSPKNVSVFFEGRRVELPAFSEATYEERLARLFMHQHPGLVVEAQDFDVLSTTVVEKPKTVWVANMTGNPDAPDKLKVKVVNNKRWVVEEIENPAKKPRALSQEMQGTWIEVPTSFGEVTAKRTPWKTIVVPPYKRVEMTASVAKWFLQRMSIAAFSYAVMEGQHLALAVKARPPSDFEPDASWPLDLLRAYMRRINPDAPIPGSEDEIRAKLKKAKARDDEIDFRVSVEKRELLKRLFFYIVDPKGPRLPSREDFDLYLNGPSAIQKPVDADELLDRVEDEVSFAASDDDLATIGG